MGFFGSEFAILFFLKMSVKVIVEDWGGVQRAPSSQRPEALTGRDVSSLRASIAARWREGTFCDVTLHAGDELFQAYRLCQKRSTASETAWKRSTVSARLS